MKIRIPVFRAMFQDSSHVTVRDPGQRFLSAPRPIGPYAAKHWEFAKLSVSAYGKTPAGLKRARKEPGGDAAVQCPVAADFEPDLGAAGWTQWTDFPNDGLRRQIDASHLRVEVWERRDPPAVAVAFGGTVVGNQKDCLANLRWFIPWHDDEYTQVVQTFAPAFAEEMKRRASCLMGAHLPGAALFSTGHSLGGGLAQQFAYALPLDPQLQRVQAVLAFDPSPVTGFYSVERKLRNLNKRDLFIDRIYERGEILALVRSLTSLLFKPSAEHATIRGVRYNLFHSWNPIADHSIVELANQLEAAGNCHWRGQPQIGAPGLQV